MSKCNMRIWVWLQNGQVMKAICRIEEGTITIYDQYDNVLLKRTGLTPAQIKNIEATLTSAEAKRLNNQNKEPFTYL
ncbi:MAG: hypothetical protein QXS02_06460 [Candidatus Thermoplasmatota archaeon]